MHNPYFRCSFMQKIKNFSVADSIYIFISFAVVGGFLEAYTYLLHGGVFCNAQTGNVVLFALHLTHGEYMSALQCLYSLLAYVAGIFVSVFLPSVFKKIDLHCAITAVEIATLVALAFIPESVPNWVTYVSVSFLCALQYNTFTECRGAKLATTFCTNNLRQTVMFLYGGITEKNTNKIKKSGVYALVILAFALGAVGGGFVSPLFGNLSALFCAAVLLPVLVLLIVLLIRKNKNISVSSEAPSEQNILK